MTAPFGRGYKRVGLSTVRRWSGALALLLPACALAQAGSSGATPVRAAWVASVDGVPVIDRHGVPVAQPFLGGLDVPRPQLADIDAVGDLDLLIIDV
jgi:hypothetical protein